MSNSDDKSRSGSSARESREKSSGSEDYSKFKKRDSESPRRSRSLSKSRSVSSRSRSRSFDRHRRYRSKSRSQDRSRSRSPYGKNRYNGKDRGRHSGKRYRDSRSQSRSRSRSPMSGRRRHLADRENPPKSRCLGVFGLSLHTRERDLYDVFSRYGEVEDVQLVYDNHSGRSRGFCFIYFANGEDAAEAKERAHGMELDGRNIRCDFSITERAHTPTPGVYLGKPSRRRSPRSSPPHRYRSRYSRSRSRSYDRHERRY